MSRRSFGAQTLQIASFFTSIAALALSNGDIPVNPERIFEVPPTSQHGGHCHKPDSNSSVHKRFLLLVSTIDGKISALNVGDGGSMEWSIDAGKGPLLSSSISRLEMMRNGVLMRLIPSLDGGLYQFDGDGVEALPFTADTLLSSSYKFSEDSSVVGGKETETYGVDASSGEIHYICSVDGCIKYKTEETKSEMLIIQRYQKTIRAVELRSGEEKWNFSVGSHDVTFMKEKVRANIESVHNDDGVQVESCPSEPEPTLDDENDLDVDLKIIIPTGTVLAVRKSNPAFVLWQHKFATPITRAWTFKDGEMRGISLFDDRYVPALSAETRAPPVLYLGIHEHQLYVQPSVGLSNDVMDIVTNRRAAKMPRIQWRPYLASSPSRTPALISGKQELDSFRPVGDLSDDKAVMLWQETEYPYDNGYYVIPDVCSTSLPDPEANVSGTEDETEDWFDEPVTVTLWNWWKEVVMISVCTSIIVHLLLTRYLKCPPPSIPEFPAKELTISNESEEAVESSEKQSISDPPLETIIEEYKSRYLEDFDQQMCLGKGGFGVVFEAKNRLDDCSYAIKRIGLPNCEKAKEKMMREVKALAKLDNSGIVRYYQAWFESPPPGWQEERDNITGISGLVTPSQATLSPTPSNTDLPSLTQDSKYIASHNFTKKMDFNPFRPFGGIEDISENSYTALKKKGSSGLFTPNLEDSEDSFDESGSYSLGVGTLGKNNNLQEEEEEESEGIQFLSSDTEGSTCPSQKSSHTVVAPFSAYESKLEFEETNDSFNIVFEDSGCAEKSSNEDLRGETSESYDIGRDKPKNNNNNAHSSLSEGEAVDNTSCSDSCQKVTNSVTSSHFTQNKLSSSPVRPQNLSVSRLDRNNDKNSDAMVTSKLYLYIQMQLCRRESLKDWLSASTDTRDMHYCLDIFDQIVCAVEYVHDSGLMHRDLKPSNIFFSMEGMVKVGDFGLVTEFQEEGTGTQSVADRRSFSLKHTDQVGTRLYMSPEQLEGHSYCHKIDIYSLGLILFELLYPFSTQMERVNTMLDVRRLVFPKRFMDNRPLECDFVRQLLAPDPEKRLSARDILDSPLLRGFADARLSRTNRRNRTRTTSSDSNNSSSNQPTTVPE